MRLSPPRLAQLLGCLLLVACNGGAAQPTTSMVQAPAPAPAPLQTQAQADPSFNLLNHSGQPIREIYASPSDDPYWGPDLLQASILPNGASFPLRLSASGGCLQDVRVVYADGRPEERRRQDTCRIAQMVFGSAGAAQPGTGAQVGGNPSFNLVNHGTMPVREIYVSSVQLDNWGQDRLGTQVLNPGSHLAVRLASGDCVNDVRVVWMNGRSEERRRLDTCRLVNLVMR